MIVDVLYEPDDLRAALTALLRQTGGKATIPGRDAAAVYMQRPRPQVKAFRSENPPYDMHLELVEADADEPDQATVKALLDRIEDLEDRLSVVTAGDSIPFERTT